MSANSLEIQSCLQLALPQKMTKANYDDISKRLLQNNQDKKGTGFGGSLGFYLRLLEQNEHVLIAYMSEDQKRQLLRDLQVTYVLLLSQTEYENSHQKVENNQIYAQHTNKCAKLIDYINGLLDPNIEVAPDSGYGVDGHPVAYQALYAGKALADEMVELASGKISEAEIKKSEEDETAHLDSGSTTKTIIKYAGKLNEKRLYWVWGSNFIKTMLSLMSVDFFNTAQATQAIKTPDVYTGSLSWGLYYFRFALNLGLLLKHTIAGPWMSEQEKDSSWTDRFATQWQQRKFALLNDSLWATANLACFFWLKGKGVLGASGDALTLALLLFDLTVAIWDYAEQSTQYNSKINEIDTQLRKIDDTIAALKSAQSNPSATEDEKNKRAIALRDAQLQKNTLERMKKQCTREWQLDNIKLATNLSYAIGLVITFAILTAPFMPFAASTLATLAVVGAVLCFALTVLYNAVKSGIEIYKAHSDAKEIAAECTEKIAQLTQLLRANPQLDDNEKKLLFLQIKKLQAQTEFQEQRVNYQIINFFRSLIVECFIPAVVMASLVFLPLGSGLAMLGTALGLIVLSNKWVESQFKPEELDKLEPLDENEYHSFCQKISHSNGFFPPATANNAATTVQPPVDSSDSEDSEDNENAPLLRGSGSLN